LGFLLLCTLLVVGFFFNFSKEAASGEGAMLILPASMVKDVMAG